MSLIKVNISLLVLILSLGELTLISCGAKETTSNNQLGTKTSTGNNGLNSNPTKTPNPTGTGTTIPSPTPTPIGSVTAAPNPSPTPATGAWLTKEALYNAACKALSGITLKADLTYEVSIFCNGEVATGKFAEIFPLAYEGSGEPKAQTPIKLVSTTGLAGETEMVIPSAIKFGKSIKDIQAVGDKSLGYTVENNGTTQTSSVLAKYPAEDKVNLESYLIKQNTKTSLGFFTIDDNSVSKNQVVDLGNQQLGFNYSFLVPGDPENKDNRISNQLNLFFQTDASTTYLMSISHVTVNNKGMTSMAEEKAKGQVPATIKKIYSIIMAK